MLWQGRATLRENLSFCHRPTWAAVLARGAPTYLPSKPHSCQKRSVWWPVHIYERYIYTWRCTLKIPESHMREKTDFGGRRNLFSLKYTALTQQGRGASSRLRWYLLALCVVILNQVLEEVHSLLGLDLIYFDQVLQREERSRVQPGVEIQGVFKGFLSFNEVFHSQVWGRLVRTLFQYLIQTRLYQEDQFRNPLQHFSHCSFWVKMSLPYSAYHIWALVFLTYEPGQPECRGEFRADW